MPGQLLVLLLLAQPAPAPQPGADAARPADGERWAIEYLLADDSVWGASLKTFPSRAAAQAALDRERAAHRQAGLGDVRARVVPESEQERRRRGEPPLGGMSEREESGGRGPGTVSTGRGDPGGVSYGTYQLSSRAGTARQFVKEFYPGHFQGLEPGSREFTDAWKALAEERPAELRFYEWYFIRRTHYEPLGRRVQERLGLDVARRSHTLRDVLWSTAVQHGPRTDVVEQAVRALLAGKTIAELDDREIIGAIYDERGREGADGVPVRYRKASPRVQQAVLKRFAREKAEALRRLAEERKALP